MAPTYPKGILENLFSLHSELSALATLLTFSEQFETIIFLNGNFGTLYGDKNCFKMLHFWQQFQKMQVQ